MFFRKLRKVRWLWHYVVPGLGVVFIFFPLYYTLFPAPAYPVDLAPYVVALWLAVGLIVLRRIMRRNPERLQAVVRDAS